MLLPTESILEAGPSATESTGVLYPNREAWLQAAVELIRPIFSAQGHTVPPVHISIGWPGSGQRSRVVGECWASKASADGINQIFLVPSISDPVDVLDTLTHELVHSVDDCEHSHGREFRKIALSVGLQGQRMRNASAGESLKQKLRGIAAELGPFPHAALIRRAPRTRNPNPPRAQCPQCNYRLAIPKKFLHLGPPICPEHRVEMVSVGNWDGW